jgi:hypothetical protein
MLDMISNFEILNEYSKCVQDPVYAIETYLSTKDLTQGGYVPFKLFPKQLEVISGYENYTYNLVTKPRQAGISTTTQAYLSIKVAFADPDNPETILIIANKLKLAQKFLKGIKEYLNQLPRWVWGTEYYGTKEKESKDIFLSNSKIEIELPNGCQIIAVATSEDALRGYTPTYLVFDEAAFIDNGASVYAAAISSCATGGKVMLISTPNGMDSLYYKTYEMSKTGDNDYNIIEMRWYEDPRYNKDLRWIKKDKSGEIIEEIIECEFTLDNYIKMLKEGYKPVSTWYNRMCANLNNNARKIAQELDVTFLGSGGNVIADEDIVYCENETVEEPKWVDGREKEHWIWEKPIEGHKYFLGADVSRGDGEDFSTIVIIDFTTMEQVMEYRGKIQPDLFGQIIYDYGTLYNAYVVVDITGGMGVSTVLKLLELGYKNLHYDDAKNKLLPSKRDTLEQYSKENLIPGFNVNGVRLPMIAHLEQSIRLKTIKIKSRRMVSEMKSFIYKNGRPDHMEGHHDDCLKSGTLIKTINGYKPIEEIIHGEMVLTHMGRYQPVEKILVKPFDGDWYDMEFQGQLKLGLSYNHPLYAQKNSLSRDNEEKKDERSWITPDDWGKMKNNKGYYKDLSKYPRQISIIEDLGVSTNHILYCSDYYKKGVNETSNKLESLTLDENFSKFLGLFLADGHAVKNSFNENGNNNYSFSLAFNVRDEELCLEMENYFNSLGINHHRTKVKGKGFALISSNKFLWHVLSECYDKNREKILPTYSRYLKNYLEYTLDYWIKGDGWVDKTNKYDFIGATTSKSLGLSMRDIAWSLGKYAVIRENKRHRYGVKTKNQFWVHIRSDFRDNDRLKKMTNFEYGTKTVRIKKSHYVGLVYNLQVANDESFIANGIVVHNCLMALAMPLWVMEHSFKKLEKLEKQAKAMLSSWKVNSGDSINNDNTGYVSKKGQKPLPKPNPNSLIGKNVQDPTGQYMWLFSGFK